MSNIDLKKFVDINIEYHVTSSIKSTRDTVVLLSDEGTQGLSGTYESYDEYLTAVEGLTMTNTTKYAEVFFKNGGIKLHVIQGVVQSALVSTIKALPNEYIVVAYTGSYSAIKDAAGSINSSAYGIDQKLLLGRTTSSDSDSIPFFATKYSSIIGAEMTIAAYLCKIDVYRQNSIADYAFTKEILTAEPSDDTVLTTCMADNMNVDMYLSAAVRNLGGNAKDGYDLVNEYVLIILHQTLTDRLLALLTEKIKGSAGVAAISTVLSQELARYATSGYLSTDKSWTDPTLVKSYNNMNFTIIRKGELLLLGYKVVVLPFTSLSDTDKALRKTPPIYVIIADSYGIRSVTINGEVI